MKQKKLPRTRKETTPPDIRSIKFPISLQDTQGWIRRIYMFVGSSAESLHVQVVHLQALSKLLNQGWAGMGRVSMIVSHNPYTSP